MSFCDKLIVDFFTLFFRSSHHWARLTILVANAKKSHCYGYPPKTFVPRLIASPTDWAPKNYVFFDVLSTKRSTAHLCGWRPPGVLVWSFGCWSWSFRWVLIWLGMNPRRLLTRTDRNKHVHSRWMEGFQRACRRREGSRFATSAGCSLSGGLCGACRTGRWWRILCQLWPKIWSRGPSGKSRILTTLLSVRWFCRFSRCLRLGPLGTSAGWLCRERMP